METQLCENMWAKMRKWAAGTCFCLGAKDQRHGWIYWEPESNIYREDSVETRRLLGIKLCSSGQLCLLVRLRGNKYPSSLIENDTSVSYLLWNVWHVFIETSGYPLPVLLQLLEDKSLNMVYICLKYCLIVKIILALLIVCSWQSYFIAFCFNSTYL